MSIPGKGLAFEKIWKRERTRIFCVRRDTHIYNDFNQMDRTLRTVRDLAKSVR
jgi:hypothetical protein